ncbi:hypothetical protein D6D21_10708 [Aureobasidium pullulans]|uniref:Uncharacterized protein n=1 Tax=Aureobasidium pullulans TaxID=5580 RepID=A0AB74IHC5_AURPU|nr:hypothetical protein D6D21_10708 [Aureobasidium pullulans]
MTDSSLLGALEDLHIDGMTVAPFTHLNAPITRANWPPQRALLRALRTRPFFKTLAPTTTSSLSCARSSQFATASSISSNSNSSSAVLRAHRAAALIARRASSPSPVRVPDPPEFDNKIPFAPWLVKMKLKLNMELSHVNEQTKMDYILSRTSGSVFERLLLRVPGHGHDHGRRPDLVFKDSADCLYQFNEWYSDRHRESRAYTDFELLRQRADESFGDFYTRFQDLVGYLNLPESLLVLKLKYKLNDRFGYYINDGKIYASVRELVDRGDRLDADIHLLPDNPYTTDDDHDHDHDLGSEASHDSHESHDFVASALEACCFSWYASSMVYGRDPCRFSYAHCLSL